MWWSLTFNKIMKKECSHNHNLHVCICVYIHKRLYVCIYMYACGTIYAYVSEGSLCRCAYDSLLIYSVFLTFVWDNKRPCSASLRQVHAVPLRRAKFSSNPNETCHCSPVTARCGLSFSSSNPDLYCASANMTIYIISCCIGPCYNHTPL